MEDGRRQEAEDRPGQEEEQSPEEGRTEAGGEDSRDRDRTWVQPQQDTDGPRRQLTCLEIPDFLRPDAAEGSTGN